MYIIFALIQVKMFSRILVPLDGSPLAEQALPHAEFFARVFGANITLLHVLEPASVHENAPAVDPLSWQLHKAEIENYLNGIALKMRESLGEPASKEDPKSLVEFAIREGKAAENIVDFAHNEAIDLVIISTHGASGLSRWSISSITHKVINMIYLPVLIVRAFDRKDPEESLARYQKILLPIDCSRRAECSLAAGIELARHPTVPMETSDGLAHGSKLILAAVIRPPELPIPEPFPAEVNQLIDQLTQISRQLVDHYLNELKERLPVECDTCVAENASITAAIQELVDTTECDLVILCAHGYSGKVDWPYGTVTRNYIEHGTKPVLVIQDVPRSQVKPSLVEIAAEKTGRR